MKSWAPRALPVRTVRVTVTTSRVIKITMTNSTALDYAEEA